MTDIQSILEQMTLEEKAALATGAGAWTTKPVERLDMPLLSLLQFQDSTLSMPADELVDDLLRQVYGTKA